MTACTAGRAIEQHTTGAANNYPLYYFVPSITADGRYMVFHSDRSGWVQLHRLDLMDGSVEQLTEGRTWDSGWAVWCEYRLRGIYNHLSVLDPAAAKAFYFDDTHLECVSVTNGTRSRLFGFGNRMPIGQSALSPDGTLLACILADRETYTAGLREREALKNMGRFNWMRDHQPWRFAHPATICVYDVRRRRVLSEIALEFHVHHVLFLDNATLLINHVRNGNGMWRIGIDGSDAREMRPENANGTVCHQVVTEGGVRYEAHRSVDGLRRTVLGAYDPGSDSFTELPIAEPGYVHTGNDPAGDFMFCELDGDIHALYKGEPEGAEIRLELLHRLAPIPFGQRYQAHPFLSPDRKRLFFTELVDGYSQIRSIDVEDLIAQSAGWSSVLPDPS